MCCARRKEDFIRILTEPENNMIRQQQALLATEGIDLHFTTDAIEEVRCARLLSVLFMWASSPHHSCCCLRFPKHGRVRARAPGGARGRGGQQLRGQHWRAAAAHCAGAHPGGDLIRGTREGKYTL